ncbi:MAG: hypothetical protein WDZ59_10635 [Pirellulales bacterium]
MRRSICAALLACTVAAVASPAEADWFSDFWATMQRDYRRNNCWPDPFIQPDRAHVLVAFDAITDAGWRRQNLLGDHHFAPDSSRLTESGELKVRWILTQAPLHRRMIFVQRTLDREDTAMRVDAVQQFAVALTPDGTLPAVHDTHLVVEGRSATTVDATNVRFHESMPSPQLPAATAGSSGQ